MFSDGFEAQVHVFFGEAGNLFLLGFEFLVDLRDVEIQLRIRLQRMQCMVDLEQFDFEVPFLGGDDGGVLSGQKVRLSFVLVDFDDGKVFEISSAFHQNRLVYFLMHDEMVMSA